MQQLVPALTLGTLCPTALANPPAESEAAVATLMEPHPQPMSEPIDPRTPPQPAGMLAEGTRWATPFFRIQGQRRGPTVFVIAGVHGDETAPPLAADALTCFPIVRGTLIVVPRANQPALKRGTRRADRTRYSDLNRNFPTQAGDDPRGTMARALWAAVSTTKPDLLIDLHEGFDFNRQNGRSVGNTILYYPTPDNRFLALRMVTAVNAAGIDAGRRFRPWKPPARGSLARAASEQLGIDAMIVETTKKDQPIENRVQQHLVMITRALLDRGLLADEVRTPGTLRVSVPAGCVQPAPTTIAATDAPAPPDVAASNAAADAPATLGTADDEVEVVAAPAPADEGSETPQGPQAGEQ